MLSLRLADGRRKRKMANEKQLISVCDVVYVIGRYSFTPDERPKVVEVQVAYIERKRLYSYATKGHGCFSFAQSDLGKTVFQTHEEAEAALAERMKKDA
jgi:hypothetical protein